MTSAREFLEHRSTRVRRPLVWVAAATIAGLGLGLTSPAQPSEAITDDGTSVELENSFWICDHAAATRAIDIGTITTCSVIAEAIKQRRFNNDFRALFTWWQQNKSTKHQAIEAASRVAANPR
ncbi:MAG: hypothetical protein ACFCUJ_02705 [Thiotrichales bacterium]